MNCSVLNGHFRKVHPTRSHKRSDTVGEFRDSNSLSTNRAVLPDLLLSGSNPPSSLRQTLRAVRVDRSPIRGIWRRRHILRRLALLPARGVRLRYRTPRAPLGTRALSPEYFDTCVSRDGSGRGDFPW